MRVLVTGAGGFIGGWLVKALLEQGHEVRGVDVRPASEWKQYHPGAENHDRRDLSILVNCYLAVQGMEQVYHLAADTGGQGYIARHRAATMLNAVIDANMVIASRDAARFYFASSSCVYPVSRQMSHVPAVLAEDWVWPADPEPGYGLSKLHTEQLLLFAAQEWGMTVRIGRHQSIFGPRGWYDGGREKVPTAVCRKIALARLRGEREIEVWGDGTQARDFVYISDAVTAIIRIMNGDYDQPLNLGSGTAVTVDELITMTEDIAGWEVRRRYVTGPPSVQSRSTDTTLVAQHADWKAEVSVREGMELTYPWVLGSLSQVTPARVAGDSPALAHVASITRERAHG